MPHTCRNSTWKLQWKCNWKSTLNLAASPALDWTRTLLNPALSRAATPAGVKATRFSRSKVSFGTPAKSNLFMPDTNLGFYCCEEHATCLWVRVVKPHRQVDRLEKTAWHFHEAGCKYAEMLDFNVWPKACQAILFVTMDVQEWHVVCTGLSWQQTTITLAFFFHSQAKCQSYPPS